MPSSSLYAVVTGGYSVDGLTYAAVATIYDGDREVERFGANAEVTEPTVADDLRRGVRERAEARLAVLSTTGSAEA